MKTLNMPFGSLDVSDGYLITTTNEGYNVTEQDFALAHDVASTHFGDGGWGLISNRVHSYSLDPLALKAAVECGHLCCLAIVVEAIKADSGNIEAIFVPTLPMQVFTDLKSAESWMQAQLAAANKAAAQQA